jgi:hypothetical protein
MEWQAPKVSKERLNAAANTPRTLLPPRSSSSAPSSAKFSGAPHASLDHSDHTGLTQANRPPRFPVRFTGGSVGRVVRLDRAARPPTRAGASLRLAWSGCSRCTSCAYGPVALRKHCDSEVVCAQKCGSLVEQAPACPLPRSDLRTPSCTAVQPECGLNWKVVQVPFNVYLNSTARGTSRGSFWKLHLKLHQPLLNGPCDLHCHLFSMLRVRNGQDATILRWQLRGRLREFQGESSWR